MRWKGRAARGCYVDNLWGSGNDPKYHRVIGFKAPTDGKPGYIVIQGRGGRYSDNGGQHYVAASVSVYEYKGEIRSGFETGSLIIEYPARPPRKGEGEPVPAFDLSKIKI